MVVTKKPVEVQLSNSIESFSRRYVTKVGNRLRIPVLLDWYLNNILCADTSEGAEISPAPKRLSQILVNFLITNCSNEEWRETLQSWQQSG